MVEQNNFQISTNNKIVKKKNIIKIDKTPKLSSENYHREEIHQNKIIVINAIWMTWIGIALIIASFIVYVLKITDSLVAGVISCLIETTEGRWILRVMKKFFWDTLLTAEPKGFSIPKLKL